MQRKDSINDYNLGFIWLIIFFSIIGYNIFKVNCFHEFVRWRFKKDFLSCMFYGSYFESYLVNFDNAVVK